MPDRIELGEEQWRARLTPDQYRIVRQKGTERPGTGRYLHAETAGSYRCVACGLELFRSEAKFDTGCGWPSFSAPATSTHVTEVPDPSLGIVRTEIACSRCGAHLGHVFDDGPRPTGLRYCVNSASLDLEADPTPDAERPEGER